MGKKTVTYHIDTPRGNFYINYDRDHHVAHCEGHETRISEDAIITFVHTAHELGFVAGVM